MTNPWNITAREAEVLDLICKTGSGKVAGIELGIQPPTVSALVRRAMQRMNARSRMLLVLEWDRWRRVKPAVAMEQS